MRRRSPPSAPPPPPPQVLALALLLLAVSLSLAHAHSDDDAADVAGRYKRSSGFSFRNFAKGRVSTGGGGGIKEIKGNAPTFQGGCSVRPKNPPHTTIHCHTHSGCWFACLRDYVFPNGEKRIILFCNNGTWKVEGTDWTEIPDCVPECRPPCQHNGICIRPNHCSCPEGYVGPQCQYNRQPCLNKAPHPNNSFQKCNSKTCTITCNEDHTFPDGTSITNLVCRDGTWSPTRKDWSTVPDCQPTCYPPCQNGGNCLSYNTCQCPQNFRGAQCQYAKEACDPQKLNFNGQYECKGDLSTLTCNLKCPSGRFNVEPANSYKCDYSTGEFLPSPIPKCIYDTMEMSPIFPPSSSHTMITIDSGRKSQNNYWSLSNLTSLLNRIPFGMGDVIHTTLEKKPIPGICYAWGDHYKTFDGKVLSFQSTCSYTLVQDSIDGTFSVNLEAQINGTRSIKVFAQDKEYTLTHNEKNVPILKVGSRIFSIPIQLPGATVKYNAHFVEFSIVLAGFTLIWDTQNSVTVEVNERLWNHTAGLCGRIDGYPENDLQMKDGKIANSIVPFVSSWEVQQLGDTCSSTPQESNPCDLPSAGDGTASEAAAFCDKLLSDPHFALCRSAVDVQQYYDACRWDFCACQSSTIKNNSHECACKSIAMFVKQCNFHKVALPNWRDAASCPMECKGGRMYMTCNPENQPTCDSGEESERPSIALRDAKTSQNCIEGCYCPSGTVLHEQQCITREQCPCQLRGRFFPPGYTMPKDCNTCTCDNGRWICTQTLCSSRCSAIGDPHYTTFDGRQYDFMGKCSYYLVKGENYSIEAENVACSGAISKNMQLLTYQGAASPSCAKSVTVKIGDRKIQLKQSQDITVNGVQVISLPTEVLGAHIHAVSSIYTIVKLPNNLTVWWDGISSVYVDAPPSLNGKTRGLCGTFTMNQKDDFLTPEEDIEQSVIAFANKWKTDETCADEPETERPQPCDINPHKKESANKYCSQIHGALFERCHWVVDPEPFYKNCMFDMCSCEQKVGQCLCPIIAAYAKECVRKGIHIDWRGSVRECGIHCPSGQQYQLCGNMCTRSCGTIAHSPNCEHQCVEGCNCPNGQTLDDETGECILISECPCQHNGMEFQPGQKEVRPSARGPQLCTCSNANWICRPATSEEVKLYPDYGTFKYNCSARNNEEYIPCLPSSSLTCKTMHNSKPVSPAICKGGCTCRKGFVLNQDTKQCIRPTECPCHHGGKSYTEGNSIQEDCNTCICKSGKWKCTERVCAGICSAWGDSHFKTFDSRIFDFHGSCDYLLAKGSISNDESFDIAIQNVECGSLGVSCSKSLTIKVGTGSNQEIITFTKEKSLPIITGLDRIQVRTAGLFVFAEVTDLGIVVQWDQSSRIYVKVDPKWKGKMKGLCGNYNSDMLDDFQTPSGGLAEVSATLFGDSWRLQPYCPEAIEITDACIEHPNRKLWAMQRCGVLKSSVFQPCHSEVPVEPYLERCIFDSCACDMGGDCECLCTALAAYAYECNANGVYIRWRSQNLCPMQCDEKCSSYSPCIDTCPKTTCENQFIITSLTQLCKDDTCVEGCEMKPCPPGQIYYNKTALECVPTASCKTVCMEENGITYYEGDLMQQDECHSCYCSHHKKSCKGTPCTTPLPQFTSTPVMNKDHTRECKNGWTNWINNNKNDTNKKKEPVPSQDYLDKMTHGGSAHCKLDQIELIECRVASTLKNRTETGLNVSCDTKEGLVCRGSKCPDFEIRLYCNCGPVTTVYPPEMTTSRKLCDPGIPNKPHKDNCHLFYQCVDTLNGSMFVEKSCGSDMMYNRDAQICDHSSSVIGIWPECARSTEVPFTSTTMVPDLTSIQTTSITTQPQGTTGVPFISTSMVPEMTSIQTTPITTQPQVTTLSISTSTENEESGRGETPKGCKPGEVWKSCGIPCNQVCLYYQSVLIRRGFCSNPDACIEGCFNEELSGGCPSGKMWRDENTCISVEHCQCYSHSGEPVKPGDIKHESDCKTCQCVNNEYICDTSRCENATVIPMVTEGVPDTVPPPINQSHVVFPSTMTPPLPCQENKYVPLIEGKHPLSNVAFSGSSSGTGIGQQPYFARILKNSENEYSWIPLHQTPDQYLQINLGSIEPVYGVAVQGGPSGYVTSYTVLYSIHGDVYHFVTTDGKNPKVFRGPTDNKNPLMQMFNKPIEAQYIRFIPQTWREIISMRVEIYGCGEENETYLTTEPTVSYIPSTTTKEFISSTEFSTPSVECMDEMGLDNGMMSDQQIKLSSVKDNNLNKFGPSQIHLQAKADKTKDTGGSWMPALNDKDQWIQFDFLEPRNLTGFTTRGSDNTKDWVEAFKVFYSHDEINWNPFLGEDRNVKIFPGNFDATSYHQNNFGHMLQTQYLRLAPFKWHRNIAVRAEVLGCFEPYPTPPPVVTSSVTTMSSECPACTGVPLEMMQGDECYRCKPNLWWDGQTCVNRTLCPCFVNHIRYDVGKVYETQECDQCVCKLNGLPECKKKQCTITCEPGQQRVLTAACGCICKPCPEDTVLCSTSNICINKTLWCNGVEDCPDDERNCPIISTTVSPQILTSLCPPISCPPGTKPVRISSVNEQVSRAKGLKGGFTKKGLKGRRPFEAKTNFGSSTGTECEPIRCIPISEPTTEHPDYACPDIKPTCAASHIVVRVPTSDHCPLYKCAPRHGICNITHNTIDTFDGIEFKHDICNHILARDSNEMKWNISMMTNCLEAESCLRYLTVVHDNNKIKLYSDMSVDLDGVIYTSHETKHLGGKYKPFAMYHVGDSLIFQSHRYGFWIIWDMKQNAKIGVTGKLFGAVEGLCGTLNGNPDDDRTTPERKILKSSIGFVKSWAIPGAPECEQTKCPIHLQIQAQEICNSIRTSSLGRCGSVIQIERFIARCMESACSCLSKTNRTKIDAQTCQCSALQGFVTTCQAADASLDLTGWRTEHGCSITCPPSFVYHDCYRHKCEPTCGIIHDTESCDTITGTCFSGCFCPDGLLRHNDQCISPDECRDCVCDGFGDPQYMSFDRSNFTFNGNCTYIASQDHNNTYQVLVTNHQCHDEPESTCTEAVEVRFLNHSVSVKYEQKAETPKLITSVDGKLVSRFPYKKNSWLQLNRVENSVITILILPIQLEVTYIFHNYAFTIRLPSRTFENKTEGLCGNCNRFKEDDFKTSKGVLTNDTNEFGLSWLHPLSNEEECRVATTKIGCKPLPPSEDPCLRLYDSPAFKKCHNILDPAPYVVACQYDICHTHDKIDAACRDMEAYVSSCEHAGICLNWRSSDLCPFKCPEGREYLSCQNGCSRTCENNDSITSKCSSLIPDGCYCPENQVLKHNECVNATKCHACDDEGHYDGDTWQQDKCTNCTCVGSRKECNKIVCPNVKTICEEGMKPVEQKVSEKECCTKITCIPEPSQTVGTTCAPPKIPICNDDQEATSIIGADNCTTIVCKCKPCKTKLWLMEDEGVGGGNMEVSDEEEEMEEELGTRLEVDNSGCCPTKRRKCYPEDCPRLTCSYPFQPKKKVSNESKCCEEYECAYPPNSCLIEDKNTGEIIVRKVGSVWHEGPCQTCECKDVSGVLETTCDKIVCPAADIDPSITADYVIDSKVAPGDCCPSVKRTACKVNETILEPGKNIVQYASDHCILYSCEKTDSGIERVAEIERCNINCKMGWEYKKPESNSSQCCGECKPIGCIYNGVLHEQGENWKSSDNCSEYFCLLVNGTVQINTVTENCPELPKEMHNDYIIEERQEQGKCCKVPVLVGCKYNGDVYEAGETWLSSENPCQKYSCEILPNGQVVKKETTETCSTNCSLGWEYTPSTSGSEKCCGSCKQVACEFEGRIYNPNSVWSSLDGCTNYTCAVTATGQYQVTSATETCPLLSKCPEDKIYQDKCCKKCKLEPGSMTTDCQITKLSTTDKALIRETKGKHGDCINKQTDGVTECQGMCYSTTSYSQGLETYVKSCNCCQPEKYTPLNISMQCEDGYKYNKTINVPSTCKCLVCSETPITSRKHRPVY